MNAEIIKQVSELRCRKRHLVHTISGLRRSDWYHPFKFRKTGSKETSAWSRCSLSINGDETEFECLQKRDLFSTPVCALGSIPERESKPPQASLEGSRTRPWNTRVNRGLKRNIKTTYGTCIRGVNVMLVVCLSMSGPGSAPPPAWRSPPGHANFKKHRMKPRNVFLEVSYIFVLLPFSIRRQNWGYVFSFCV